MHRSKKQHLLDDLVGKRDQRRGKFDAKQLGGLEIDDELEIGGSLNRQIGRFGTFQYLVYVAGSSSIQVRIVWPVGH